MPENSEKPKKSEKSDWLAFHSALWPYSPFLELKVAPEWLNQSINPNWNFGTVIYNDKNSANPKAEGAILTEYSYGRQLGRLQDVIELLLELQKDRISGNNKAVQQFNAMLKDIRREKTKAKNDRIKELQDELEKLQKSDDPE